MSDTTFVDNSTVIVASWLNDVNDTVYGALNGAQTPTAARTALGLGTAAQLDVGTTANKVVQMTASAKLPAVDGSLLTNIVATTVDVTGATGILPIAHGGTGETSAGAARTALGVSGQLQEATRFTAGGTADAITGTLSPAITGYTAGLRVTTTPGGANTMTGPTLNLNSLGTKTIKKHGSAGTKVALVAGDYNASGPFDLEYDGTDFILLNPVASSSSSVQIQPISASVAANALTISASALSLDFRSTTLGSGTVTTVSGTPSNLVISSGSTLGTTNAVASRIAVLAINNAGTIELAAVNISGGNDLSETGLISTTAEGGAGAADSANVIYSATARTNVAYRVIGYIESTQATAGTWATAPSTIQGAGGNALTSMQSLGYSQTWQSVSRTLGTTYYNTTGRPIQLVVNYVHVSGFTYINTNGLAVCKGGGNTGIHSITAIINPGNAYSVTVSATNTLDSVFELR